MDTAKTPLYAEDLLAMLNITLAGFNGSCERTVGYDALRNGLETLIQQAQQAHLYQQRGG